MDLNDFDFGVNSWLVEDLLRQWQASPGSVDKSWQKLFAERSGAPNGNGATNGAAPVASPNGATNGAPAGALAAATNGHIVAARSVREVLLAVSDQQERVAELIEAYRERGHLAADLDPLGLVIRTAPDLALANFGLSEADLDVPFSTGDLPGPATLTLREIIARLQETYCRSIGVEFMHGEKPVRRQWLQTRMESSGNRLALTKTQQLRLLQKLTEAEVLETFLHTKYVGAKRFSLEGGESLIPMLDMLIDGSAHAGADEVVIGMAHRGRLNVIAHILEKDPRDIFSEFEDKDAETFIGRGDVKYHMGHSADVVTASGQKLHLSLAFNPSHLEWVNGVVEGRVRAKQDRYKDLAHKRAVPLLVHGDAAFSGQGLSSEILNLSELKGYSTGGTIHVVLNNQVGFTTDPRDGRSTPYATDVSRMLRVPVFHVNGEDPEAVAWVAKLAAEYRFEFHQDVVIDLYCYRKHGHNETDEPSYTQPVMYRAIKAKKSVRQAYVERLLAMGQITQADADTLMAKQRAALEAALETTRKSHEKRKEPNALAGLWARYRGGPDSSVPEVATGVAEAVLRDVLRRATLVPDGFTPHPNIVRTVLEPRRKMADGELPLDWASAETLALGTLLTDGAPVRFSGQDSRRGTFSQRHAVLSDAVTGEHYTPLSHLAPRADGKGPARFEIYDSPLSEAGVLGFDYGYSLDYPDALVVWEAQFGDFANAAQVVIDQFIAAAEDKWLRLSGLVMMLPHGFEGQGPEHSSARLERFLNLSAEDNWQITYPTTPAQLFHLLRRQVLRPWRKPLVIMTPKSLLRHKAAVSALPELSGGAFQRVIADAAHPPATASRALLCSGKVYYDLLAAREARQSDAAIVRLELLYPFPAEELRAALAGAKKVVFVQEEPWNMGAQYYLRPRLEAALGVPVTYVTRPESASPATGSAASHKVEQALLMEQAFTS